MASTAVITVSGNTDHFASSASFPGTVEQFSAQDSTMASEGVDNRHLTRALWDFGDSTTAIGHKVGHIYTSAATRTVSLTCHFSDGSSASTTTSITTVAPPSTVITYYIRSDGSDGATGFNNNNNSVSGAKQTLDGVVSAINALPAHDGAWYFVYINGADTVNMGGGGVSTVKPKYGPFIIAKTGAGANPIINGGTTQSLVMDETSVAGNWGRSIYIWNVDFHWTSAGTQSVLMSIRGSQLMGCNLVNGGLFFSTNGVGGSGVGKGCAIKTCSVDHTLLTGIFGSQPFLHVDGLTCTANGDDGSLDHQMYYSAGADQLSVVNCITDATGAVAADSGIKCTGCTQGYFAHNIVRNGRQGFDVGSNTDNSAQVDVVYEYNYVHHIGASTAPVITGAFSPQFTTRVVIRNNIIANCTAGGGQGAINLTGGGDSFKIQGLEIYNNTFYNNACADLYCENPYVGPDKVIFRNNLLQKSGNQNFVREDSNATNGAGTKINANLTIDNNLYYATGTMTNPFRFNGTQETSFANWKSASGQDTNSIYGSDPLLTDPVNGDFSISAGSAAIDVGATLGEVYDDYIGTLRPSGSSYDIGAYEYLSGNIVSVADGATFAMTGEDATGSTSSDVISVADGAVFNLSGQAAQEGISSPADVGSFSLNAQSSTDIISGNADGAAFNLTGQDASGAVSGDITSIADFAAFQVSGQNADSAPHGPPLPPDLSPGQHLANFGPSMKEVYRHHRGGLFK